MLFATFVSSTPTSSSDSPGSLDTDFSVSRRFQEASHSVSKQRKSLRRQCYQAFIAQDEYCYYCDHPMWIGSEHEFAVVHGISHRQARHFRCTGEHLIPYSEGGDCGSGNIVAACHFCNRQRHRRKRVPDPITYRKFVQKRVSAGRWNSYLLPFRHAFYRRGRGN